MTKLPPVLASEFCADHVEDIPFDVRQSASDSIRFMNLHAELFPKADWDHIDRKAAAIAEVGPAWYSQ